MKRQIVGLKWAKRLAKKPPGIPVGRAREQKAFGVRYERALARTLGPVAQHGVWFEYEDFNGPGCCQVDFLIPGSNGVWAVLESKYTWTLQGHLELERLYCPVVSLALGPARGVVICRNLVPEVSTWPVFGDLIAAMESDRPRVIFHWHEGTPIWGKSGSLAAHSGLVP